MAPLFKLKTFCAIFFLFFNLLNSKTILAQSSYCAASNSGCAGSNNINNFSFAGIVNNGSGCTSGTYSLYTATTGSATQNCSLTLNAAGNGSTYYWAVWIDYNRDTIFQASENVFLQSSSYVGSISPTITIPANAQLGDTRLRIRMNFSAALTANSACGNINDSGETEDYIINIKAPIVVDAGPDQSLGCANTSTLAGNNPTPNTGTWTVLSGAGTFANASLYNTTVSGIGAGTNKFLWTITDGSCPVKDSVMITRSNVYSNAGPDQSVCSASTSLAGNDPVVTVGATATGQWTVVSGSGTFTNASLYNTAVTSLGPGQNVFRWTVSDAGCVVPDDVNIFSVVTDTWTGLGNAGIWNDANNWDLGIPINCANVLIPVVGSGNYPNTMPATVSVKKVTISAGASMTVPGTTTFTVGDSLVVNGTLDNLGKINMTANKVFSIGAVGTYIHEPTITPGNVSSANMFVNGIESFHPTSTLIIKAWYNASVGLATNMQGDYGNVIISPRTDNTTVIYTTAPVAWYQNNLLQSKIKGNLTLTKAHIVVNNQPSLGDLGYTGTISLNVGKTIIINDAASILYGLYHVNGSPSTASSANVTVVADSISMSAGLFYLAYNLNATADITGTISCTVAKEANFSGGKFVGSLATNAATSSGPTVFNGSLKLSNTAIFSGVENTTAPFTFNGSAITMSNASVFNGSNYTTYPANGNVAINNARISIDASTFTGVNQGTGTSVFNINSLSLTNGGVFHASLGSTTNGASGNITFNADSVNIQGATSTMNLASSYATGTVTSAISGNVTLSSGRLNIKRETGSGAMTVSGNLIINDGDLSLFNPGIVASTNTSTISLTVNGNYVQTAGNFDFDKLTTNTTATRTLNVKGNFTHSGGTFRNIQETTSTLVFNGTTLQTLTGPAATRLYKLTLNNTAGVQQSGGNFRVINQFTLTSGVWRTNDADLIMESTAPAIAGTFGPTRMVATNGVGFLRKELTATATVLMPIGDVLSTAEYSPITIDVTAGTFAAGANVSARVDNSKHPNNGSNTHFLNRYWVTSSTAITGLSADLTMKYLDADIAGTETQIAHGTWTGALPWVKGAVVDDANNQLIYSGLSNLRQYTGITLQAPTVNITGNAVRCSAEDPTVLTANTTGDNGFTYAWSPSTGLSDTTIKTPGASPSTTTSYTVTVTDTNGFQATSAPFNLTVNPSPAAPVVTTPIVYCQNDVASPLSATGTTLTWYTVPTGGTGSSTAPTPSTTSSGNTSYYVTETQAGCESTRSEIVVTVNPQDDPAFSYANAQYCQTGIDPSPTGVATSGGTYSSSAGLSIDANTGTIDLSASTVGSYTITYLTNGACPNSTTFAFEIIQAPVADFTYNTAYCQNESNPTAQLNPGSTAGTFSSSSGLVFLNTGNGQIDLANSTPGTYTVTNTIPSNGACPVITATFDITINAIPGAPVVTSPVTYCVGDASTALSASGSNLLWYTTSTGGTGDINAPTPSTASSGNTSYFVSQTISNCESPRSEIVVTVYDLDDASFTYSATSYCQNESNPSPNAVATPGGNFSGNGALSINATSGEIDLLASPAGSYTVTYTTNGNCPQSSNFALTIEKPDTASFTYTTPICIDVANPSASLNPGSVAGTFSTANLTFNNTSTGEIDMSTAVAGTHRIYNTLAATATCAAAIDSFDLVIQPATAAPTVVSPVVYCQNATASPLSATGTNLLWYTSSSGGTGNSNAPTPSTSTPGSTNYYVSQTANGCEGPRALITVTINSLDDATFAYGNSSYCSNSNDPTPTANVPGGTYSSTAGLSLNGTTGEIDLSNSTAGTYSVTYTTNAQCPNSSTLSIVITDPSTAAFTYNNPVCISGSNPIASITAGSVGGTFSSTQVTIADANTGEIDLSASIAGTYRVYNTIAANGNCAVVVDSFDVVISNGPAAPVVSSPVVYCQNATASALGATGSNLLWYTTSSGGTGTTTAPTPSTSTPGSTDFYVSQSVNGCEGNRAQITVTINNLDDATFSYGNSTYCSNGADPTPTANVPGGTYSSTAGLNINGSNGLIDLSNSTAGTYSVLYTTNGQCPNSSSVSIAITDPSTGLFSYNNPVCISGPNPVATITAGSNAGTFSSSQISVANTATGEIDLSGTTPGTYRIYNTLPASGNCAIVVDSFDIVISNGPAAPTVISPVNYCQNATATPLTASGSNLLWYTTATGGTGSAVAPTPSTSTPGTFNFYVSQTVGGCEGVRAVITVNINALDDANFGYSTSSFCQTGTDPIPTVSGVSGGTFSASANVVINASSGEIDLSASTLGTHAISYTTNGTCSNTSSVTIQIVSGVVASFSYNSPSCLGGNNPVAVIANGSQAGTFSSNTLVFTNNQTGEIDLSVASVGTHRVYNNVSIAGCGSAIDSFDIVLNNGPAAPGVTAALDYCLNATATSLTATGSNLLWYAAATGGIGSTTAPIPSTSNLGSTNFYVSQTANGCESPRAMITVNVNPYDDASFSYPNNNYCEGGANPLPTITGTAGGTFTATNGLPITASTGEINMNNALVGNYIVTYTTNGMCSSSTDFNLQITDAGSAAFSYNNPICINGTNPIAALNAGSTAGTFSSTLTLANSATGEIDLSAISAGTYRVYNTFTPAGCGTVIDSFDVVIDAGPANPTVTSMVNYCINATASPLTAGGSNLLWYTTANGGTGTGSTSAPTPSTSSIGSTNFYVSQTVNGCEGSRALITVNVNDVDDASFSYANTAYCEGATNPTPTVTGLSGGQFTANNGLVINATTGEVDLTNSSVNSYIVTYTTNGTCPNSSTFALQITDAGSAAFSYNNPICINGTNPIANLNAGSTAGTFSSSLTLANSSTGEIDLSVATAGTYRIYNTFTPAGCGTVIDSFDVVIDAGPAAPVVNSAVNYCVNETASALTANGNNLLWYTTATGGTGSATAPTPSTATPGTTNYYVSQTANGCEGTRASITVNVNAVDDATFSYPAASYCVSQNDPLPNQISTSGGAFSGNNGLVINASSGLIDLDASGPGTYTITYQTNGVCPSSYTQTLQIDDFIDGSFYYTGFHCVGPDGTNPQPTFTSGAVPGTFSATPMGLVFVNVNTGEIDIINSAPGNYTVTNQTQQNGGCPSANHTSNITLNNQPTVTVADKTISCGQGVLLTSSVSQAGGTYFWSPGNQTTSSIFVSPLTTTSYILAYSIGNGCNVRDTAIVTVNQIPVTLADFNDVCANWSPFALSGGSPAGGNYSGTGVNGNIFYPAQANLGSNTITYTVTSGQCSSSATAELFVNGCAGINEASEVSTIDAFPNPTTGQITLRSSIAFQGSIEWIDLQGKTILWDTWWHETEKSYDLSDLPKGIYFARLQNKEETRMIKIIVQ